MTETGPRISGCEFRSHSIVAAFIALMLWLALPAQTLAQDEAAADSAESARSVAEMLQDEDQRQEVIDLLLTIADASGGEATEDASIAQQIAAVTVETAEQVSTIVTRMARDIAGLFDLGRAESRFDADAFTAAALRLIGVIVATIVAFYVFQALARPLIRRLAAFSEGGWWESGLALIGSAFVDAVAIGLAYGTGYVLALTVLGDGGQMDIRQSYYLNAFLIVELIKVVLRRLSAPRHDDLRLFPIGARSARFLYDRFALVISIIGYGVLVAVPIVNTNLSFDAGRGIQFIIVVVAVVLALRGIWTLRRLLRDEPAEDQEDSDFGGVLFRFLERAWPWVATVYVVGIFLVAVTRPYGLWSYILTASAISIGAVIVGALVVTGVRRGMRRGVPLPQKLSRDLPLLQKRVDRVVPIIRQIVRVAVLLAVIVTIIDAWGIADIGGWMSSSTGSDFVGGLLSALLILLVGYGIWIVFASWVEYRLSDSVGRAPGARERTLLSLLRNAVTIVLAAMSLMLALSEIGIDIGPLLAGAGVVGLAVGFGAQTLVQDVITGVFIQLENALHEGDVVTVGGTSGVVEKLTVRSVGLRDLSGIYHVVPFSSVSTVSNFMRDFAFHVAEIGVAYKESIPDVKAAMHEAFDRLKASEFGGGIQGDLEMHGVTELGDSAITVRARIKTDPRSQWGVGRHYTEFVKEVFDERNIEIPFPHVTLFMGTNKDGSAPPLPIKTQRGAAPVETPA